MFKKPKKQLPEPELQAQLEKKAAQDWLPVKDILNSTVCKRDGSMVAVLRVDPINLSLKSDNEKQRIITAVHEALNGQQEAIQIVCLPRPLDLDKYLNSLNDWLRETTDGLRRRLLQEYVKYVAGLVTGGEVMERRYYILLEQKPGGGKRQTQREDLIKRAYEFGSGMAASGLRVQPCEDLQIIDLLFSFLNPAQAAYEQAPDGLTNFTQAVM